MTTEDKLNYLESFITLVSDATRYEDAKSHADYTRGLCGAWYVDGTITMKSSDQIVDRLKAILFDKKGQ